jgi:hypothetical protein
MDSSRADRKRRDSSSSSLTPVYTCALLTFLLVTVAPAGVGDAACPCAPLSPPN